MKMILSLTVLLLTYGMKAESQEDNAVSGIVRDSVTGRPLPSVSVCFDGTAIGTKTDADGKFSLKNEKGCGNLSLTALCYAPCKIMLRRGRNNSGLVCSLSPKEYALNEVVIKSKRDKYRRKNNPAVELVRNVIANKNDNRIESRDRYQVEIYDKLSLSLDNFHPNYDKKFYHKFQFLKNYTDSSEFDKRPILTVSVRESLSDYYYNKKPKTEKTIIKAKRMQGVDDTMDDDGTISANLDEIFKPVNVFDNDIPILLNRFVSPLSSLLAIEYYKYYITDTVRIDNEMCTDLSFVPVNDESYGFTGHLYITQDGHYAVKKVTLTIPAKINLNWVDKFRIDEEYKRMTDGAWALDKENTYINFCILKGSKELYAHKLRSYDKYRYDVQNADSVFGLAGEVRTLPLASRMTDDYWIKNRHTPLLAKESAIDDMLAHCRKVPIFNAIIKTAEILLGGGYIPTADNNKSKFDFGPMYSSVTANRIEGLRLRVGGMTTANLNPYWFGTGYMAYGMRDKKWKYSLRLTHSFNKKQYHEGESPVNNLSFIHEYDLYTPGQDFTESNKDNLFLAIKVGAPITKMQYIRKTELRYEREWLNGLTWKSWFACQNNTPAGTLQYWQDNGAGNTSLLPNFNTTEIGMQLRFAPGERAYNSRRGKSSMGNLSKDAPIFKLSQQLGLKGVLGGDYTYNHTELSAQKRIWLSSFGRLDAQLKMGKVWNQVPFPLLIIPNANQSLTIQPESFHLMNAMEFVADQYVSFNATYYMKGLILNRLPLIKWLRLREVCSFNMICGSLTDKNNPAKTSGLFQFPDRTRPLGGTPYMECSFGLENIFNVLRIDYYRRLTYLDVPGVSKSGIRVALRFTF